MSEVKAYLLTPDGKNYPNHKADFGLLKESFKKKKIETVEVTELPPDERAFVVIPGYDSLSRERKISIELNKIKRVVLFITSDEGGLFNPHKLSHPNMEVWVQSPFQHHNDFNKYPIGCPFTMKSVVPEYTEKKYDVFFSGQITHQRRKELAKVMPHINNSLFNPTKGFMQGYEPAEYYKYLAESKIVPAPAGNITIDSFRFYEAIEMLCVPIGDSKNSIGENFDFYGYVFDHNLPVERTHNWKELQDIADRTLADYPSKMHQVVSWWIKYKRDFANKIMEQVYEH